MITTTFDLEAFERACDEAIAAIGGHHAQTILTQRRNRADIVKEKLAPQTDPADGTTTAIRIEAKDGGPDIHVKPHWTGRHVRNGQSLPVNCQCRSGLWQKDPGCLYHGELLRAAAVKRGAEWERSQQAQAIGATEAASMAWNHQNRADEVKLDNRRFETLTGSSEGVI